MKVKANLLGGGGVKESNQAFLQIKDIRGHSEVFKDKLKDNKYLPSVHLCLQT